jgi:F-type H+-transporting ATPase subunit delta
MKYSILAKKYITAFRSSLDNKDQEKALVQLDEFIDLLIKDDTIWHFLKNPIIRKVHKIELIEKIAEQVSLNEKVTVFVKLLIQKDRLSLVTVFSHILHEELAVIQQVMPVKFISAIELDKKIQGKLVDDFKEKVKMKINPEFLVDPEIIGGIKVQIGNIVYDGTIYNSLQKIRKTLAN